MQKNQTETTSIDLSRIFKIKIQLDLINIGLP